LLIIVIVIIIIIVPIFVPPHKMIFCERKRTLSLFYFVCLSKKNGSCFYSSFFFWLYGLYRFPCIMCRVPIATDCSIPQCLCCFIFLLFFLGKCSLDEEKKENHCERKRRKQNLSHLPLLFFLSPNLSCCARSHKEGKKEGRKRQGKRDAHCCHQSIIIVPTRKKEEQQ